MRSAVGYTPARPSDVAVAALKTLMTGYQLWGDRNACAASELSSMFRVPAADLMDCLRQVAGEGWVLIDDEHGTVSLTAAGARALAVRPGALDS